MSTRGIAKLSEPLPMLQMRNSFVTRSFGAVFVEGPVSSGVTFTAEMALTVAVVVIDVPETYPSSPS